MADPDRGTYWRRSVTRCSVGLAASATTLAHVALAAQAHAQSLDQSAAGSAGWMMLATFVAAFVLSALAVVQIFRRLIEPRFAGWLALDEHGKKRGRVGAYIGAVGVFPVALFLAVVVGGNFGGAIGGSVSADLGPIIGVGIGIFVVSFLATALGAAVGFIFAGLVSKPLQ